MTTTFRVALLAAAFGLFATPANAQDGESGLEAFQSKSVLNEDEIGQVRAWVEQRVRAIAESSAAASTELRRAYTGSQGFKDAYAKVCVDVIRPVYGRANLNLIGSTQLIAVLGAMNDMQVHATLVEALSDKRVAVRTAAAAGLGRLRATIARAGGGKVNETLTALQQAGEKETSPVALKTIYRALDYQSISNPTAAGENVRALLGLLKARQAAYAKGAETPAWAAEIAGLRHATRLIGSMSETDRTQLAEATGQILLTAVLRYANDLYKIEDGGTADLEVAVRNDTEILIQTCEEVLAAVLKPNPAPNVSEQMRKIKPTDMKIEMKGWAKLLEPRTGKNFDPDLVATGD